MIIKNNNSWNFALFVNQCKCTTGWQQGAVVEYSASHY